MATGQADLGDYLTEIRNYVCSRCVERPRGGPPCAPLGKNCGVEMHLPELIAAIREVRSKSLGPYLDHNRRVICENCVLLHSSICPCPMDYLSCLIVEAVEAVDERRLAADGNINRQLCPGKHPDGSCRPDELHLPDMRTSECEGA
jgi:hypothetical protein